MHSSKVLLITILFVSSVLSAGKVKTDMMLDKACDHEAVLEKALEPVLARTKSWNKHLQKYLLKKLEGLYEADEKTWVDDCEKAKKALEESDHAEEKIKKAESSKERFMETLSWMQSDIDDFISVASPVKNAALISILDGACYNEEALDDLEKRYSEIINKWSENARTSFNQENRCTLSRKEKLTVAHNRTCTKARTYMRIYKGAKWPSGFLPVVKSMAEKAKSVRTLLWTQLESLVKNAKQFVQKQEHLLSEVCKESEKIGQMKMNYRLNIGDWTGAVIQYFGMQHKQEKDLYAQKNRIWEVACESVKDHFRTDKEIAQLQKDISDKRKSVEEALADILKAMDALKAPATREEIDAAREAFEKACSAGTSGAQQEESTEEHSEFFDKWEESCLLAREALKHGERAKWPLGYLGAFRTATDDAATKLMDLKEDIAYVQKN